MAPAHVLQRHAAELGDRDPDLAGCIRDRFGSEHFAGMRFRRHSRGEIHRGAEHVSVTLDRFAVMKPDAQRRKVGLHRRQREKLLDERDARAGGRGRDEHRVAHRLHEAILGSQHRASELDESRRNVGGVLVTLRFGQSREACEVDEAERHLDAGGMGSPNHARTTHPRLARGAQPFRALGTSLAPLPRQSFMTRVRMLNWASNEGRTRWLQRGPAWVGAYESWRLRQGAYVSSRGSMMVWSLDGEVTAVIGPRRQRVELRAGDGLLVKSRTPFLFEMRSARMLITETDVPANSIGLRHVPSRELPKEVREWTRECWASPAELLRASEMANRSSNAPGTEIPFPSIHNTARMLAIKEHLDALYTEPIRLERVARSFKLDPFYLSRAFSQTTGIAPKAFVQSLRFEHFLRQLLAHPERSLTSLAFEAGVPDYSAFSRWLKQRIGASPSELVREESNDQVFPSREPESRLACSS